MRLCTIMNGGKAVVGVKNDDGKIIDLSKQMPRGPKSVVEILAGGKNVVTPIANGMHWMQLADGPALREELDAAGQKGSSSIYFTGIDPGFVTDALAINMSSVVADIEQIRTWEFIDYSNYPVPEVMLGMGYGRLPADIPVTAAAAANVITLTSRNVGALGNSIAVTTNQVGDEGPLQQYLTIANGVTGTGIPSLTAALAALGGALWIGPRRTD